MYSTKSSPRPGLCCPALGLSGILCLVICVMIFLIPSTVFAEDEAIYVKPYNGPYNHPEISDTKATPHLEVNNVTISPMAGSTQDLVLPVCSGQQTWALLKEFTNWKDVNRFGFYTDLGTGSAQTLVFSGSRDEGYSTTTSLSGTIGLWMHNDTDGNLVFSSGDSYLFSQRSLTIGSGANEHQWFMVYNVSAYKGTGAVYEFICDTEDFTTTGDFDYLVFIDDNHTSANFDHNDMILGISCNNQPPQISTPPQDTTVMICALGEVTIGGFDVDDPNGNLASVVVNPGTYNNGEITFTADTTGTYTFTIIATDTGGLADTAVVDIIITLNNPPIATCFGNKNDTTVFVCSTAEEICIPGFSAVDPDGNLMSMTAVEGYLNGDEFCFMPQGGTNTLTFIATDSCGAADTCITTVYVEINVKPTVTCPGDKDYLVCDLSDITIDDFSCDDADGNLASCMVNTGTLSGGSVTFTPVAGVNEIILTATDDCGKTAACTTLVTVTVNSAPTATCPGNQNLFVCNLDPITINGFVCADIDGNLLTCSVDNGTLTGNSVTFTPIAGANVITLTATDECGQTAQCQTTINVTLNSAPTATCPGNQNLFVCNLDPITINGFVCDDVDGNLAACSVDNGTLAGSSVTFTPVVGANVITLTATDDCGQTTQCQTTVTVTLNSAPTAACPGDQNLFVCNLDPITIDGFVCADIDGNLSTCSVDNGILTGNSVTFTPVVGQNTITLTATDDCGETDECTVTINVAMNTPPTAACPGNQNLFVCNLDPITIDGFVCGDADGNLVSCSVDNGTLTGTSVTFTPVVGVNTITLTATDECGQTAQCQTTIAVTMNSAPTAACPGDQSLFVCDLDPITIDGFVCNDIDGNLATCSVDNGTLSGNSVTFTPVAGVNVITLTATDDCGLTAQCQTTVTVALNSAPTATCPGDQNLFVCNLDPITIDGFVCNDIDGNLAVCSVDNGTLSGTSVTFTPVAGVNTITLTATDDCGQTAQCQTTVTVTLNSAPTATCPGDQNLFVCDLDPITIDGFLCNDVDGNLTTCAVDNGTLAGNSVTFTPVMGQNAITLTATDACGETASCTVTITIGQNSQPTATCPSVQDMLVCDLSPITVDGFICDDPDGNLTGCSVDNGNLNGTQVTFTPVAGQNTINLTATDACGETATCQVTFNVTVNVPPTAACPGDQSFNVCNLDPITIDGFVCNDADGNLATCAVDNGTLSGTSVTFTPVQGTNTITLTATDDCGETATCVTTITIDANLSPTATCPGDQSLFVCNLDPITINGFSCSDPEGMLVSCSVDNGALNGTSVTFTPVAGVNTIILTAVDDCGNQASCVTNITVTLNSAPTTACPGNQSLAVCDLSPITLNGFACNDNDGNLISCSVDNGTLNGSSVTFTPVAGANVITLTAEDACGLTASCQTTVTVSLNNPPTATCPGNQSFEVCSLEPVTLDGFICSDPDGNLTSCTVNNGTLNGTSVTFTPVAGQNIITLTATDACGATDMCTVIITVSVNNPPTAQVPADQEFSVCGLSPITLNGFSCSDPDGNLTSCEVDKGTLNGNSVTFTPVAGMNSITLTATDDCDANASATVDVNVILNSPPVVNCVNDTSLYVFDLSEICIGPFGCSDPDDDLATCVITGGTNNGGMICFTPQEGANVITVTATDDCGAETTCETIVNVTLVSDCPIVKIEKVEKVLQGYTQTVHVTIANAQYAMGGFDFLIHYDASVLSFLGASPTGMLISCDWEYFSYENAPGACGDCPLGPVRVFALADYNNGPDHPFCYQPPDGGEYGLFDLNFYVSDNRTYECQYVPIQFYWTDCGDNSISSVSGDTLFIDRAIYSFEGVTVWDEFDDAGFPESGRIEHIGAPDACLNTDPNKPSAIRCIDFVNGGIDVICADSIDDRGDINLNGIPNEIADAVVFTNYFVFGMPAFTINLDGQKAASDVNADGIALSVADLVYLVRVITGDALPHEKLTPNAHTADFRSVDGVIATDAVIGGAYIILKGRAEVSLGRDADNMAMKVGYYDDKTHVIIYSFDLGASFTGEFLETSGEILSIEAADYSGSNFKIGNLPSDFALISYPNPFNPSTTIEMALPAATAWTIDIININGQKVAGFKGNSESGKVKVIWEAEGMPTGVYFIRAQAEGKTATKKIVLLK